MSAKWRALQHRHRYTYSAVIFPTSYTTSLSLSPLSSSPNFQSFYNQLTHLISLSSIYSQVSHAKTLANSFSQLLSSSKRKNPLANFGSDDDCVDSVDASLFEAAARFYLEVLFLENSLPLHRTLLSVLGKIGDPFEVSVIKKCFEGICEECGGNDGKKKRFCLCRVALSVMGMQKLGFLAEVVEGFAGLVAWDVVCGLESVVLETMEWARPSPIVMEQCQEALSCLYYLLQRFPGKFKGGFDGDEVVVMERVLGVLLSILKSMAFSRDCFVAAGVSFCAALQVCLSAEELGLFIIEGIFNLILTWYSSDWGKKFSDAVEKIPFKGDLCLEIHNLSLLSRLCLIRGILTAVSRNVLNIIFAVSIDVLNGYEGNQTYGTSFKTILYDGILPELCNYCENPIDSHFNFHALTVLQICMQQMKSSMLNNLTDISELYNPIPEEMGTRILRIIWNNLEDPLSQTVKQVNLIFDLFLDIQSTLCWGWGAGGESIKSFLQKIASDLLRFGPRCKGRYVPLAALTRRLGSKTMLEMSHSLLFETIQAYADDDVCCAATTFLKGFLECLRDECWNSDGVEIGYTVYRGYCLPPFLYGLASGVSKLRSNLNTYALPVLLEVDVDSVFPLLAFISVGPKVEENGLSYLKCANLELGVEQEVAVLVSLLKVCRSLALIEGDIDLYDASAVPVTNELHGKEKEIMNLYAAVCIKGIKVKVLVEWLVLALIHADELLRVDAAETLFLNPKTSSLPSHLELTLLKEAVPLNMRSCSTGFQMKWTSLFRKFFSRVRTALERHFKQGSWQPLEMCNNKAYTSKGTEEDVVKRAEDLFNFMRWFCCFLFFSCYPSAPYKRKIMAMELILIMLNVWPIVPSSQDTSTSISPESCLYPYSKGITSPDSTLLLVGSIIDSWDRLRENSFRILLYFPTPLPGISSNDMVQKVIGWAKKLVCSPRVRESDAGALTLRLIFRKYVLELGWIVRASANVVCSQSQSEWNGQIVESRTPVIEYVSSLIDWLNAAAEEGERNLSEACKNSFVHGVLLALRYTFEELEWNSDAAVSSILEMRHLLKKLLELVMRITSLALWVVSADAWYLQDIDEMPDDDTYLMDELDAVRPSSECEDGGAPSTLKHVQDNRPTEQIVMVGCWLAMKEVSLLLGTIIRKIPLPSGSCSDSLESETTPSDSVSASTLAISNPMLDLKQLEQVGNHFLEVLLKMKHNGAIDKTRAGFTALCNRLLCSNDPRLCMLTESWMEQLMERTVAKGQIVDDLLRRSAGIPAAFIALFLSEPEGAPKKLLPRALQWLIGVANSSLLGPVNVELPCEPDSQQPHEVNLMEKTSKIRDEGVIPTVHAFNVLRAAFNDTNLATDTSGFAAEALIIAIRSFSSPYWEIRNSACLAYTALIRRMIGFLNVQKRESARRALTGLEFFHRYPSLHPFLYNELKVATDSLGDPTSGSGHLETNLAKAVHPSLCPMLILLSRLKPSTIASESGDDLDPFLFMPFIRMCSTQSNLRIRVLASRALTSLVSSEKLQIVLLNIASELPCLENQITATSLSSNLANSTNGTCTTSFNSIHGMLLQLSSLLDKNCRNLADFAKKEKILGDLIHVLAMRSWIASPKSCPCPVLNTSFLRVLDHMLGIARTGLIGEIFYAIRNLLLELSTVCLDVEVSYGLSYCDPTIAELREQAAISYFSCVLQASKEEAEDSLLVPQTRLSPETELLQLAETRNASAGLQDSLVQSLSDPSYEVRLATLKWLLKFLKSIESSSNVHHLSSSEINIVQGWTKCNLQATMMKLLDSEKYHRCVYYILRILFTWNLLQFQKFEDEKFVTSSYVGNLDFNSMFQFWDKLRSLYDLTRHTKTRETVICCMAVCVKQYVSLLNSHIVAYSEKTTANFSESNQLEKSTHLFECITFFVNLVKEHSSSSEPVTMRKAAAESIIASGLLEQAEVVGSFLCRKIPSKLSDACAEPKEAVDIYACQVVETWFTCIKLLEDEDDGIRQRLAMNVQKSFSSRSFSSSSPAGGVPTQVEKVIELCFRYLSFVFGHWIDYFDCLSRWVLDAANSMVSNLDPVRRVFDKEIDNHHEEKLIICQICCSHLEKLPIIKSRFGNIALNNEFRNYLYSWRMKFYDQLMSFGKDHVQKLGEVDWIGGVGNHKDAFLPLYANLLGFYALSNCVFNWEIEVGMLLLSDVIELGKTINPFFRNPLISNLYLLVVKSHEKNVGFRADISVCNFMEDNNWIWEGFDPYFLLR